MDNFLIWWAAKKGILLAGMFGGGISGGLMNGALVAIGSVWGRVTCGAICGAAIATFGAAPLAKALERPDYLEGVALCLGLFGLSFVFKVLKAWNDFDLSSTLTKIIDAAIGRIK